MARCQIQKLPPVRVRFPFALPRSHGCTCAWAGLPVLFRIVRILLKDFLHRTDWLYCEESLPQPHLLPLPPHYDTPCHLPAYTQQTPAHFPPNFVRFLFWAGYSRKWAVLHARNPPPGHNTPCCPKPAEVPHHTLPHQPVSVSESILYDVPAVLTFLLNIAVWHRCPSAKISFSYAPPISL